MTTFLDTRIKKLKKASAYDEEFIVAKLKLISASIISLELNNTKPALHFHQLSAYNPASQITPKFQANNKEINLIYKHAARVRKHDYYNSRAPRKLASNTNCIFYNLKYVDSASKLPPNTSLARRNTKECIQLFQNRNELALALSETQIIQPKIQPIRRHSTNTFKSHHSQIKSVLFCHKSFYKSVANF